MMEIYTLDNAGLLDKFVTNHPRGHYMQTTAYGKSRPDYDWAGIILRDDNGRIIASIALHSRTVRYTGKKLFYAPRGPVFTTPAEFRAIIGAAKEYCMENNGYILRIDPPVRVEDGLFRQEAEKLGFRVDPRDDFSTFQPKNVYQTHLAGLTEAELLYRFHSKTRYNIRLAQRRGVTVREGSFSDLPVFSTMMEETGKRDGFSCKPESFYSDFLCSFGDSAKLVLAEKDGRVLAGAIEVIQGRQAWYVYGCSFSEGREDMPNYLLQWEMMRMALERGCTVYDFRGVEGEPVPDNPHYGLHRFKQGFDARFLEYVGQMDLVLRPVSAWIIQFGIPYLASGVGKWYDKKGGYAMKHLICLILMLTLLLGCSPAGQSQPTTLPTESILPVETVEPVQGILLNARRWEGNPELMELELPFKPFDGNVTLGMLGENLLFWQILYNEDGYAKAIQFWLMDSRSGELLNQYTQDVGEYGYGIQVQPHRVCICDSVTGTVTILGERLELQGRWEADLGWNQCFMGYGDTLYILMDEYLLKRDLSTGAEYALLEGVTGLYSQSFEPTGVNLGHYDPDTGKWVYLWLEFATDILDYVPFRGQFISSEKWGDSWLCYLPVGYDQARVGNGTDAWDVTLRNGGLTFIHDGTLLLRSVDGLSLYNTEGQFLSGCELGQVIPSYLSGEPIWMEGLGGYLMMVGYLETNETRLIFWPMGIGNGEDLEAEKVDLTLTEEQELAQFAQRAKELGERFGLEILVGTDCRTDFADHTMTQQTEPDVIDRELDRLEQILASFPEGFMQQLCHEEYQRIQIHLVRNLIAKPHYGTGGDYEGVVYTDGEFGGFIMAIDTDDADDKLYYHELSHIIEDYVSSYCGRYIEEMYFSSGWEVLNPEGFSYTYDKANYIDLAEAYYPYFIDSYALINDREDRSRIFEYACTEGGEWMFAEKPGALEKLRFYAKAIRMAFDTTGWPEVTIWEKYLGS